VEERVEDLLSQLSTAEKLEQLHAGLEPTGGIERLGIPGFQGWSGASLPFVLCRDRMGVDLECHASTVKRIL
jgi:hypothetical protein